MDTQALERIMIQRGLVIRAIPSKVTSVCEARHIDSFPQGTIRYMEQFKRDMLIVERVPRHAGKFIIECDQGTGALVRFSGKQYYDTIEDALDAVCGTPSTT
jgi:hypothetical protein